MTTRSSTHTQQVRRLIPRPPTSSRRTSPPPPFPVQQLFPSPPHPPPSPPPLTFSIPTATSFITSVSNPDHRPASSPPCSVPTLSNSIPIPSSSPSNPNAGNLGGPPTFTVALTVPALDALTDLLRRCASTRRAISSFLSRSAVQNPDDARIRLPCQRKTNGTAHMSTASPARREQAPAMPRRRKSGAVARGRSVARREREHEAAALAEAAKIS